MSVDLAFKALEKSGIDPMDPGQIEKFPTVYQQTGSKRTGPLALHQDNTVLLEVSQYNYDPSVLEFALYCRGRGIPFFDVTKTGQWGNIEKIHAAKMQDCWELWLRHVGALPPEKYNQPKTINKLTQLLRTIYYDNKEHERDQ